MFYIKDSLRVPYKSNRALVHNFEAYLNTQFT